MSKAADRVWFSARLWKAGKAPFILASGGADEAIYSESEARSMQRLLLDLGVPPSAIALEEQSRDTIENAHHSAAILASMVRPRRGDGAGEILLVTSASHMARARHLFEQQGLVVHAAPTDHELRDRPRLQAYIPSASALEQTTVVMKEWVGSTINRLKSEIQQP